MSTLGYTVEFNADDLKVDKNFSTIFEEDEENAEREMEVRNNLEDVVGPDDISSDDESGVSDDEDDSRREMELRNNLEDNIGPNDLSSDDDDNEVGNLLSHDMSNNSSDEEGKHPFDDDDNYKSFPRPLSFRESPNDLHINLSPSPSISINDEVTSVDANMPSIMNTSDQQFTRFQGLSTDQLQYEYFQSGGDKERLQILYETRGKEIDGLRTQLEHIKRSSKTACDKLNQSLKLNKTKLQMLSASEKQLKALLVTYEGKVRSFNADLMEKAETINNLELSNSTLRCELESAKSTISSLEQHAVDLTSVKGLVRSKQIHEDFIQKLQNIHKEELEGRQIQQKASISKIDTLKQQVEMLEAELQISKERFAATNQNKDLTITSLQLSLQTMKDDGRESKSGNLAVRNKELETKLEALQNEHDRIKKTLDSYDLMNRIRLYKDTVPVDDSLENFGLIKALDFNNVSSVERRDPAAKPTPKNTDSSLGIEAMAQELQRSLFRNQKSRDENIILLRQVREKDTEIKHLQAAIQKHSEEDIDQNTHEEQIPNSETVISLRRDNQILNERIGEVEYELQIERGKMYKTANNQDPQNVMNSLYRQSPDNKPLTIMDDANSTSLIMKYQNRLENEKLQKDELEIYYKNQIKELMNKFNDITTSATGNQPEGNQAEIVSLNTKIQQHTKQIEILKTEKQKLIDHYEEDIRQITDTLMDKEGEIQEVKNKMKSQSTTCDLFNNVICELNANHAQLRRENETMKKQISTGRDFIKGKLTEYRDKYQSQQASFAKYKVKADDRIDHYFKQAQRIAKEMDAANLKTIEEIRTWLNSSRSSIVKSIDSICAKLKQSPMSYELIKYQLTPLLALKESVSKLNLKDPETHFVYYK